jgi:hypothetical protein
MYRAGFVLHRRFLPLADETPDGSDFRKTVCRCEAVPVLRLALQRCTLPIKFLKMVIKKTFRINGVKVQ